MKHAVIICTQPVHGTLYFFVLAHGERHYLFGQAFYHSLWSRYQFGVLLDDALDWSKCHDLPAEVKVREKIFKSIPHIEKEYGLALLRRSRRSSRRAKREVDEIAA